MGDNTTLKVTIEGENLLSGDLRQLETEFVQIEASAKKLTKSIKDVYTSTDDEQFAIQAQWNQAMNEVQAKTAASMAATRASIAAAVDASEVKIKGLALSGVTSVDRLSNAFKGLNIKSQFGYWKDTAVMVSGEAVYGFTKIFSELWKFSSSEPIMLGNYILLNLVFGSFL